MINSIKQIMNNNNIEIFGITNCVDFSFLKEQFALKLEKGFLAEFDSSDFEERALISKKYPDIKSIISIAVPYPHFREEVSNSISNFGYSISEYACIPDYHKIINLKLSAVIAELQLLYPGFYFVPLTDSNPLFEKEIAKLCGTGIFGKNSLIYNKYYGSYMFLGEIVSDCQLPEFYADSIPNMLCKECSCCINSCPNGAIEEPYMINAKKCISYCSSTKKSFAPELLRDNLWGCDICQSVCPVNKISTDFSIFSDIVLPFIPLEQIILSSNRELQEIYSNFAIGWSGVSVLKRNAIFILYNKNRELYFQLADKLKQKKIEGVLKEAVNLK